MKLNEITEVKAGDLEQVKNYDSGNLIISYKNLTSLDGCPEKINGLFNCANNQLTSFEYFPKYIAIDCNISYNNFTSFKDIDQHIEYITDILYALNMKITSGFSDLFGIEGLKGLRIDFTEAEDIVNKYLPEKDLIEFQDEMIKSGFEKYL